MTGNEDRIGGALFVALGMAAVFLGSGYGVGSPAHMGPGFFPVVLGIIMAGMGAALAREGFRPTPASSPDFAERIAKIPSQHSWRGFIAIVAGLLTFIGLGLPFGLLPAAFGCVFVSALGDRDTNWKSAAVLSAVVSIVAVAFFAYVLGVQMPVLRWPGSE